MFTGKHGGVPLQVLSAKKRRQLTSNTKAKADDAHTPHQGSKEAARRRRQMQHRLDKAMASQYDGQHDAINKNAE